MSSINQISVIVPSNHHHHELLKVVGAICYQTITPSELIIVDSTSPGGVCPDEIQNLCALKSIKLLYVYHKDAFPGKARNIGLNIANGQIIAFLDVKTIPIPQWLEISLKVVAGKRFLGVFGGTSFIAKTSFERLVRDAFYGVKICKTLPGSVFRREVIVAAGQLIDWVRAGEDTEWMLRVGLLKLPVIYPNAALVEYHGLIGISMHEILKKWHRNYTASYSLPHLLPQKLFLWLFLYPLIVFISVNWNYLFANWHEDSALYIAHITKMVAIAPILAYLITRGILLPIRRDVSFLSLFPFRFIAIAATCLMADLIKAFVFTVPRFRN
jgi:glycosyltransferase involved in cell wall biosynthesis